MKKFYKEGLSFKCQGCGRCCEGFPGYVWISDEDIKNISRYLKIEREEFLKKYTRAIGGRTSLLEGPPPLYSCIFLKERRCTIYKVRPYQCISFPFWPINLLSKDHWNNLSATCPGVLNKDNIYTCSDIENILKLYKKKVPH